MLKRTQTEHRSIYGQTQIQKREKIQKTEYSTGFRRQKATNGIQLQERRNFERCYSGERLIESR